MPTEVATPNRELLTLLFELCRASRCCQQEAMLCEDLTFIQFYTLDLVARADGMKLAELHEALLVDKSTTTRLLEPLLTRGYLRKQKLPSDARAAGLKLTAAGRKIHARVGECVGDYLAGLESEIPSGQRAEVYAAVRLLLSVLQGACGSRCC
jgi:DNA-binding MarR family transcriptional regulator